jgi:hypothetical protein
MESVKEWDLFVWYVQPYSSRPFIHYLSECFVTSVRFEFWTRKIPQAALLSSKLSTSANCQHSFFIQIMQFKRVHTHTHTHNCLLMLLMKKLNLVTFSTKCAPSCHGKCRHILRAFYWWSVELCFGINQLSILNFGDISRSARKTMQRHY